MTESKRQYLTICAIPSLNTRKFLKFAQHLDPKEADLVLREFPKRMLNSTSFPPALKSYETEYLQTQLDLAARDEVISRLSQPRRLEIKTHIAGRADIFGEVNSRQGLSIWAQTRRVKGVSVKTIFDIGGRSARNLSYDQIVSQGEQHLGSFSICKLYGIASQTVWSGDFQEPDAIADACTEVCSRFISFLESI